MRTRPIGLFNTSDNDHPNDDMPNLNDVIAQFRHSNIEVAVSCNNGTEYKKISDLIDEAMKTNKNAIFTFTPGPFLDASELPDKWMQTPRAIGCTAQLNAFEAAAQEEDSVIYAINKHSSAYQLQLLAKKNWPHLFFISDENNVIENTYHLPKINLPDKRYANSTYFGRLTFGFKKDGQTAVLIPESPLDAGKAQTHVNDVKNFTHTFVERPGPRR